MKWEILFTIGKSYNFVTQKEKNCLPSLAQTTIEVGAGLETHCFACLA